MLFQYLLVAILDARSFLFLRFNSIYSFSFSCSAFKIIKIALGILENVSILCLRFPCAVCDYTNVLLHTNGSQNIAVDELSQLIPDIKELLKIRNCKGIVVPYI